MEELKNMILNKIMVYDENLSTLRHDQRTAEKLGFSFESKVLSIKITSMVDKKMYLRELIQHIEDNIVETNNEQDNH